MNKFYITTPIYYVNAKPHIGHAYTTVAADVLARFHKLKKDSTFFLTGTDEHGLKIQKKAEEAGKNPQIFVDEISAEFIDLWRKLGIEYSGFIRTSSLEHKTAIEKALEKLKEKNAIYKGSYKGLYCVGCEQFKNESDLIDGKCPDHNIVPEQLEEESWMMKMTDIQQELIQKIKSDQFHIAPERYKNEILSFLESQILNDVSISRKNVRWGIPLPFDPEHTTYVWVDALLNYLTGIGWIGDEAIPKQWPANVQLIGKDILRVHATIWPAILMHLGIELPKMIFVHGHILSEGKKMSKTLGNVISIDEMLDKFGTDATRYLLMSAGTFGEDVDVTIERLVEKYNADLANGLGNLVSRTVKMIMNTSISISKASYDPVQWNSGFYESLWFDKALERIWSHYIRKCNKFIDDVKPWDLAKNDQKKFEEVMNKLVSDLALISELIMPFLPETSEKIKKALETKTVEPLFQRIK